MLKLFWPLIRQSGDHIKHSPNCDDLDGAYKEAVEIIAVFRAQNNPEKIRQLARSLSVGLENYERGVEFGSGVINMLHMIAAERRPGA